MVEEVNIVFVIMVFTLIIKFCSDFIRTGDIVKKAPNALKFGYSLFYTDQKNIERKEGVIYSKLLTSKKYQIRGKPDFIYKSVIGKRFVPMELKSGAMADKPFPYEGDLLQLCAYFLIIEDCFGSRPKEGRLIYRDCMFVIKNTSDMRRRVLSVVSQMRNMLKTGTAPVDPSFAKCRYCLCNNTVCEYCGKTKS